MVELKITKACGRCSASAICLSCPGVVDAAAHASFKCGICGKRFASIVTNGDVKTVAISEDCPYPLCVEKQGVRACDVCWERDVESQPFRKHHAGIWKTGVGGM